MLLILNVCDEIIKLKYFLEKKLNIVFVLFEYVM